MQDSERTRKGSGRKAVEGAASFEALNVRPPGVRREAHVPWAGAVVEQECVGELELAWGRTTGRGSAAVTAAVEHIGQRQCLDRGGKGLAGGGVPLVAVDVVRPEVRDDCALNTGQRRSQHRAKALSTQRSSANGRKRQVVADAGRRQETRSQQNRPAGSRRIWCSKQLS